MDCSWDVDGVLAKRPRHKPSKKATWAQHARVLTSRRSEAKYLVAAIRDTTLATGLLIGGRALTGPITIGTGTDTIITMAGDGTITPAGGTAGRDTTITTIPGARGGIGKEPNLGEGCGPGGIGACGLGLGLNFFCMLSAESMFMEDPKKDPKSFPGSHRFPWPKHNILFPMPLHIGMMEAWRRGYVGQADSCDRKWP